MQRWPERAQADPWDVPSGWRVGTPAPTSIRLSSPTRTDHVRITGSPAEATAQVEDGDTLSLTATLDGSTLSVVIDGRRETYRVAQTDGHIWLAGSDGTTMLREVRELSVRTGDVHAGEAEITSPMPGSVIAVGAEAGAHVTAGQTLVVVEAMKMEHSLTAPVDGVVDILVAPGDQVMVDQLLARVTPHTDTTDTKEDAS